MNRQYIETLLLDIDRVLQKKRETPYDKATIPSLMYKFRRYLNGEIRHIKKWEVWNALDYIASLYNMTVVFNRRTRLAYFHVKNAPYCYSGEHPCMITFCGTFPIREAESSFFDCIASTKEVFIFKYKDNPIFNKAINSLSLTG